MILTCPACATRYYAGETVIGQRARKVRCAKCAYEWIAEPPVESEVETPAPPEPEPAEPPFVAPAPSSEYPREEPSFSVADADGGIDELSPRRWQLRGSGLDRIASIVLALMLLVLFGAAAYQYRTEIVRTIPALGGIYAKLGMPVNARGIEIRNHDWRIENRNGRPVLVVTGEVVNITNHAVAVPRLSLAVRDQRRHELYRWSAPIEGVATLKAGDAVTFTTTLENPPPEAQDIEIRFDSGS